MKSITVEWVEKIKVSLPNVAIEWNSHALQRMIKRGISRYMVLETIILGEVIEAYPIDYPFPSVLLFAVLQDIAVHVVVSFDEQANILYVITSYFPDNTHFLDDYKTRRK